MRYETEEDLEYYSVIRSIGAIENSDVCILMIDAQNGMQSQDQKIFSLVVFIPDTTGSIGILALL